MDYLASDLGDGSSLAEVEKPICFFDTILMLHSSEGSELPDREGMN